MSPEIVGAIGFGLLIVLLICRLPIVFCFILVGSAGLLYLGGQGAVLGILATVPYTWGFKYVLLSIPLFLLMGYLSFASGISRDLYNAGAKWLGRLPGGLALATIAACTGFAACTGSSVASAAAMTPITVPEMDRYGYDRRLSTGVVAMGGTLAILIPPSITFIIYAVLTEESVGRLFLGGVFPGLMLASMYMAYVYIRVRFFDPAMAPPADVAVSWRERLVSLKGVWGMFLLFLLVMGGIWGGVVTPTEAGALGAFGALVLVVVRRKASRKVIISSLQEVLSTTGMIFAIIIGVMIFTYFTVMSNLPTAISNWAVHLPVSRYLVIAFVILMYIPLGMFMDAAGMLVLTVPVLYPMIIALGFNGVWFGIIVCVMTEIGMVTPPVAMNVFVIAGALKDIKMEDIYRGVLPLVIVALIGVALLVAFPQITLWLPNSMFSSR